jgi:hypothetical protein
VFYPLWVFQSHHQWFLPPTNGIRAPFVRKQRSFGIYPNFQSCQKHILIIPRCRVHPYELTGAKISFIGARSIPHAPFETSVTVAHAPSGRRRAPYSSRDAPPKPLPSRAASRAKGIFSRIFPVQPSESSNIHNQFPDRFNPFLTHFQPSQTGSLLFWAFQIHLQCPFCQQNDYRKCTHTHPEANQRQLW